MSAHRGHNSVSITNSRKSPALNQQSVVVIVLTDNGPQRGGGGGVVGWWFPRVRVGVGRGWKSSNRRTSTKLSQLGQKVLPPPTCQTNIPISGCLPEHFQSSRSGRKLDLPIIGIRPVAVGEGGGGEARGAVAGEAIRWPSL